MAIRRARKALLVGITGLAAGSAATATLAVAQAAPRPAAPVVVQATAGTDMPSAVEDFSYPGAAKILQEQKITLERGDGHIVLSNCAVAYDIKVKARVETGLANFCFTVRGNRGYVALKLPESFGIWTKAHPVQATLTADGQETVVNAVKNDYTPVGETGDSGQHSTLVELRVTS